MIYIFCLLFPKSDTSDPFSYEGLSTYETALSVSELERYGSQEFLRKKKKNVSLLETAYFTSKQSKEIIFIDRKMYV